MIRPPTVSDRPSGAHATVSVSTSVSTGVTAMTSWVRASTMTIETLASPISGVARPRRKATRVPSSDHRGSVSSSGPTARPSRTPVIGIHGVDVAVLGVGHEPVCGEPVRRRQSGPCADIDGCRRDGEDDEEGDQGDGPPRDGPDRPSAQRQDARRQPPLGEAPARPLSCPRGDPQDVVGEVRIARRGGFGEPRGQVALEAVEAVHTATVRGSADRRSSAAMAARSSARARCRRDWAVPIGMSRVSATAEADRPR